MPLLSSYTYFVMCGYNIVVFGLDFQSYHFEINIEATSPFARGRKDKGERESGGKMPCLSLPPSTQSKLKKRAFRIPKYLMIKNVWMILIRFDCFPRCFYFLSNFRPFFTGRAGVGFLYGMVLVQLILSPCNYQFTCTLWI